MSFPVRSLRLVLTLLLAFATSPAWSADGLDDAGGAGWVYFDLNSAATDLGRVCAAQSDGKILVAGTASSSDGENWKIAVARINPDGLLDPGFYNGGKQVIDLSEQGVQAKEARPQAIAVDSQGRILIAGSMVLTSNGASIGFVTRLFPDGFRDTVWGIESWYLALDYVTGVIAMGFDSADRLWILGRTQADGTGPWIYRLLDSTGNPTAGGLIDFPGYGFESTIPTAMAFAPDGKVLVAGWGREGAPGFLASMAIARLGGNPIALDPTFGSEGTGRLVITDFESAFLRSIALQPDLGIVVAGEYGALNEENLVVTRLDPNGTLSDAFTEYVAFDLVAAGGDGSAGMNRMVVQSDGKIVVAATAWTGDTANIVDVGVARILPGGAGLDSTFGGLGTGKRTFDMPPVGGGNGNDTLTCLALSGGKAVLIGSALWAGTDWDFSFRRLTSDLIFADGFESGTTFFWSAP